MDLLPLFVNLSGRRVALVGGGTVAAAKLTQLQAAGAEVVVIAPQVHPEIERSGVRIERREFRASDLDEVWLVVAAAPPEVNKAVAQVAERRRVFVNAVDDPAHATAFLSGVVRRDGVTLAISTSGDAPGLTGLLREALDSVLPDDLDAWMREARGQRAAWKQAGVPMAERRPLLLQALNRLYDHTGPSDEGIQPSGPTQGVTRGPDAASPQAGATGHVSIVGAGPGDPGLLTRRAVARLRSADLVLYDALVDQRVIRLARGARRFFVGKRAGRHTLSQQDIHVIMVRAARRGRRVVRLKGGDPFVFGRGGEEALALLQAGVSFDLVPGVTSAVAAPALAGIPVTHRGLASAFLVASGHDPALFDDIVRHMPTAGVTIVVLMGLARRSELAAILIARGFAAGTPSALIAEAATARQQVWRGTLGDLAANRAQVDSDGPALFVVGDVAALELATAVQGEPQSDEARRSG